MKIGGIRKLDPLSQVADIVVNDHRTAEIFRKYDIAFCCGGKLPLQTVCEMKGLDYRLLQKELEAAMHVQRLPADLAFNDWDTNFLVDYIINIHHKFLQRILPVTEENLAGFARSHQKKLSFVEPLLKNFSAFSRAMLQHLEHEESIIFPYIRRIAHAYNAKESYAGLLVRTLRKPVENVMQHEHEEVHRFLLEFRTLTNNYSPQENACTNHRVLFSTLEEIDSNIVQHVYLENEILFSKAIRMENELLKK